MQVAYNKNIFMLCIDETVNVIYDQIKTFL